MVLLTLQVCPGLRAFRGLGSTDPDLMFIRHSQGLAICATRTAFIGTGLKSGESTIVIAAAARLKGLERGLLKFGVDLVSAIVAHRYIALPADEALDHFMVKHWPDEALFAVFVNEPSGASRRKRPPGSRLR